MSNNALSYKIATSNLSLDGKKLPPLDPRWKVFNASFENVQLPPMEIMNTIYNGFAITTHHKDHWRTGKNYLCGQHIGLDFDTEDEKSKLTILANDKFIQRYASFIHTTISHTPETPRARVVFLLDQPIMQATNYEMAVRALLWLFRTADRQCKEPVRFFYGATHCQFEFVDQVLPLEVVKKLIQKYTESGVLEKRRAARADYHPPASQDEVSKALKYISAWGIEYDEWLSVLMAIHAEFGDGGYQLAENWADGKDREVEYKWRSFKQDGNTGGRVTIATLYALAKQGGWRKDAE
jgi:hypothetical protein